MNRVQLQRLKKLRNFIANEITPKHFNMKAYRYRVTSEGHSYCPVNQTTIKNKHACGTVGCLMGWTPFAFPNLFKKFRLLPNNRYDNVDWESAAKALFGFKEASLFGRDVYSYLFSGEWAKDEEGDELPNKVQKKEALKRLDKVIATKGKVTREMEEEAYDRNVYEGYADDY